MNEELILVPEAQARRALCDRAIRLKVLSPFGAWVGRGSLRVLRVRQGDAGDIELVVGYESYHGT